MATEVKLPRLGQGMESGTIVRWLKGEGEAVKKREPLYELDTDKVTQEVEAEAEGVLLKILVNEGEVDVGTTIAVIGKEGESFTVPEAPEKATTNGGPPVAAEKAPEAAAASPTSPPSSVETGSDTGAARVKASPLARRMARERGLDLAGIAGTGPEGRIIAEDVEKSAGSAGAAALVPAAASGEIEVVQLTSTRKTIARRLTEAWQAPVFQLGVSADMTELLALRERLVDRLAEGDVKPTVNDVLTKLAGVTLTRHRALNAVFSGEEIQRFPSAHVGMAVAAPNGLVVPVIRDADRRTIQEIARSRADLVGRAREGKLTLEDLQGAPSRSRTWACSGSSSSSPCSTRHRWRSWPSAPSRTRPSSSTARSTSHRSSSSFSPATIARSTGRTARSSCRPSSR